MLLPMTSRLLLEALRPERPCWKLMAMSLSKESRGCRGEVAVAARIGLLVECLDRAVGHEPGLVELEVESAAVGADRVDAVAHQRGRGHRHAAAGRGDAE